MQHKTINYKGGTTKDKRFKYLTIMCTEGTQQREFFKHVKELCKGGSFHGL